MLIKEIHPLVLASLSPRRLELLRRIGLQPTVIPHSYGEEDNRGSHPIEIAKKNAEIKFLAAAKHHPEWLLAADTLVSLDGDVLGKPKDAVEAEEMLRRLSGRRHDVVTAYCIGKGSRPQSQVLRWVVSSVEFHRLPVKQIKAYVATGEPLDKAGAYGIQGAGMHLIRQVLGSPSNVMGLPMLETTLDLVRLGVACFACPN